MMARAWRLRALTLAAAMLRRRRSPPRARVAAQWATTFEQFYFADGSNWAFRNTYPAADRLFNAFDYGHAILYERLYTARTPIRRRSSSGSTTSSRRSCS